MSLKKYIEKNLKNGNRWMEFESGSYQIVDPASRRVEILFKDGYKVDLYDWWYTGVGKLKSELMSKSDNCSFLVKFNNFSGLTISNKIIDDSFINRYKAASFFNVNFEDCQFQNFLISHFNESEGVDFTRCNFTKVQFSTVFLNGSYFNECTFIQCKDWSSESNSLEGEEWSEMVHKEITVSFNRNKFENCNFGFNTSNISMFHNKFYDTEFNMCNFKNAVFYDNEFHRCRLQHVRFECDGKKSQKYNYCKCLYGDKYYKCNFKNVNFSTAILIFLEFEDNKYDNETVFSMKSYEELKNILTKENFNLDCFDDRNEEQFLESYVGFYHRLFNEYKHTTMTKKAYEFYYVYKYLEGKLSFQQVNVENLKSNACMWFKNLFDAIKNKVFYITCGYGERPLRTLGIGFIVLVLFSFMYLFLGIKGNDGPIVYMGLIDNFDNIFPDGYSLNSVSLKEFWADFQVAFYFSVISFATIGYGDFMPLTPGSRMLVCFQSLLSIILIALFTGIIVRKAFRD